MSPGGGRSSKAAKYGNSDFVVVANRLPVDISVGPDGEPTWTRAPGGLVTALSPVMASAEGAWVGWGGAPHLEMGPFTVDGIELVPVTLSEDDIAVASLLESTGRWARGDGPEPYPLAEACQDHLLGLAIGESARTGADVRVARQPWA